MTHRIFRFRAALLCGIVGLATGCGGDSDDGSPAPTATAPAPSPSPSPSPSAPAPTPSPTPGPTPSPTGSPTGSAPPVALANVGDTLRGPAACVGASTGFAGPPPRLDKIGAVASLNLVNSFVIDYKALDTYAFTIGGSAAGDASPAIKAPSWTGVYDYFNNGDFGEFELYRNAAIPLTNVTLGRLSGKSNICFYAVGGPAAYAAPAGVASRTFTGFVDGIAADDRGENFRLFQSPATVRVNYATGRVDISMDLQGRELPFSTFVDVKVAGRQIATGTATLTGEGVFQGTVSTPQGFTGSVRGQLYGSNPSGMALAFTMQKSSVEFAFGAAGLDAD